MTTQKLSSEKLLDRALLKNMTRRRLPHILVAFLANFFSISVPCLFWMGNRLSRYLRGTQAYEAFIERSAEDMQGTMTFHLVMMFLLGIYFGIITLGYMMKRRSAHFYHALPQSRETLYTTSVVSALICAMLGGAINLVIALSEIAAHSMFVPEVLGVFFTLLGKNIVYFLVAYSITVFAGSFSGNGLVQFLMSLVILFYPVVTYAGIVLMRALNTRYFWTEYYYGQDILQWLSPAFYAGWNYWGEFKLFPTLLALLVCAALLLGGMAIYRRRAIENSERPILFKPLGEVLKFMLMFTVTMFAGLFFYAIGDSFFHMFFGFVCGAVLSFMLFNTILAKSPKAMFKGVKGLIVFAITFALFVTVVGFDIFNYDDYIPAEDNIAFADIRIANAQYEEERFEDPETLTALSRLLKNQRENNKKGTLYPSSNNSKNSFIVQAVIYTKLGLPVARNYRISKYTEGAEEFLRLYANDKRMAETYKAVTNALTEIAESGQAADVQVRTHNGHSEYENISLAKLCTLYVKEFGTANYERFSKPVVAVIELYDLYDKQGEYYSLYDLLGTRDYSLSELPVYADMTETIRYLEIMPTYQKPTTYRDNEEVTLALSFAAVYDTRELMQTGRDEGYATSDISAYPYQEISPALAEELALLLAQYNMYGTTRSNIFFAIDTDYILQLCYGDYSPTEDGEGVSTTYYDGKGAVMVTEQYDKYGYDEQVYLFPKGYVPAEVKALFE